MSVQPAPSSPTRSCSHLLTLLFPALGGDPHIRKKQHHRLEINQLHSLCFGNVRSAPHRQCRKSRPCRPDREAQIREQTIFSQATLLARFCDPSRFPGEVAPCRTNGHKSKIGLTSKCRNNPDSAAGCRDLARVSSTKTKSHAQ